MNNKKLTIIISSVITIFLLLLFIKEHYAVDTYVFEKTIEANVSTYLSSGRVIMSLFLKLCLLLKISGTLIKTISLIIALISLLFSNIILNGILSKIFKDVYISSVSSTLLVYSPFIIELFLFPEFTGIMSLGILFSIISLKYINNYFDSNEKHNLVLSFIFSLLCVLSYQGIIGVYISLSIMFIVIKYKDIKSFIKNNIIVVSIYGLSSLFSLFVIKLMGLSRIDSSGNNIIESIKNIVIGAYRLLANTSNVFPRYFFPVVIILMIILIVIKLIKRKELFKILLTGYLFIVTILFSIAPQLFLKNDMIWVVARSNICMGMLLGILSTYYFSINKSNDNFKIISLIIIFISSLLQLYGWINIRNDHYYTNEKEKEETYKILNKISDYEKENKITISNISIAFDSSRMDAYNNVKTVVYDVNARSFYSDWGTQGIIEYYSANNYKFIAPSLEFEKYCKSHNWYGLDDEQFVFENETLNLCNY